ncbi:Protein of unknown function [Bacillus mycoides]|nr:Protein of unknown function [Bacillus mycoides]
MKVKGQWMYLYRAVDSKGYTIDFHLSKTRDHRAAKRFFKKALQSFHVSKPRVITQGNVFTIDKDTIHMMQNTMPLPAITFHVYSLSLEGVTIHSS